MSIETLLGMDEFDPSVVREDVVDVSRLDEEQKRITAVWCDDMIAQWEEAKEMAHSSWKTQEKLRDKLKSMYADPTSYPVQSLIGGSASQFVGAYDMICRRIRTLKALRKALEEEE